MLVIQDASWQGPSYCLLYTGTIRADFHMSGMAPWFSDVWKIIEKVIERAGEISFATS